MSFFLSIVVQLLCESVFATLLEKCIGDVPVLVDGELFSGGAFELWRHGGFVVVVVMVGGEIVVLER